MKLLLAVMAAAGLLISVSVSNTPPAKTQNQVIPIHAFEEPVIAIGTSSDEEISALVDALHAYQKRKVNDDVSAITSYLNSHPQSPWTFSLLANLGIVYRQTGYFSRAVDAWEQAWTLGKGAKDQNTQALANRVAEELATLLSSLGRQERLESLLAETKGRNFYGASGALLMTSNEDLWLMKNKPGDSFKCGPYALESIRAFADKKASHNKLIFDAQSGPKGFSLTQVRNLSDKLKMRYQMAKRLPGSEIIVPAVAHWKSGHYAALLQKRGAHYLTKDPTFAQQTLVTSAALEDESDGYFLVPAGPLPKGWQTVSDEEGGTVWGRGNPPHVTPTATKPTDKKGGCTTCCTGMAVYNDFLMLVSLSIQDNPVGYTPPVGPDAQFTITYNQLEATQPATFTFSNFGPCWNFSWLSYVIVPSTSGGTALVNLRGGGQETYANLNTATPPTGYTYWYLPQLQGQATLWVKSDGSYERHLPDGSVEYFAQPDSPTSPVRVFLTTITDARHNSITLGYDTTSSYYTTTGNLRLTTVTDALGLQTNLTYGLSADPLKVTLITDPYNRSATFNYSSSSPYQLTGIVDVVGITSAFTYGSGSVISQMTTPYGNTTFASSSGNLNGYGTPQFRSLTVTEPDGSNVKLESRLDSTNYPTISESYPTGTGYDFNSANISLMEYRNTYYWDKKATHDYPDCLNTSPTSTSYLNSHIYHWLHTWDGTAMSPVLESEKPALENRIWYAYPGQSEMRPGNPYFTTCATIFEGTSANPAAVVRIVTSSPQVIQMWQYQYLDTVNPAVVTAAIDPIGRQTNYTYDDSTGGIDLTLVTQNNGTVTPDTIWQCTSYNSQHEPLTLADASTGTTTCTYNTQGQLTKITPPLRSGQGAEPTMYGYTGNFLTSITRPMSGAVTTIIPDTLYGHTINRTKSVSDAESYTKTYNYDNLDRVTQIAYPDSTTETYSYLNPATSAVDLDMHKSTDRQNRATNLVYQSGTYGGSNYSTRHLYSMTDPSGRATFYNWCTCGAMTSITDPKGSVTTFNRDVESRLTSKVYQDTTLTSYTYDSVGRLSTTTDARGDVGTTSYNLDNTVSGVSYSLATGTAAPPTLSYGYDMYYPRLTSAGGVSFSYYSPGVLGAGQVATGTNTLTGGSAVVAYSYDEWGRKVGSNIDSANSQSVTFDSLGEVTNATNLLGSFTYAYFDPTHPTGRLGSVSYPNGQSTTYNYYGVTGDERLEEIKNVNGSTAISDFQYTGYNAEGTIASWTQQADSGTANSWANGYDGADQLTGAVQTTGTTTVIAASNAFQYDAAGNRTLEQTLGYATVSTTDGGAAHGLNQLTGTAKTTTTTAFTGSVNKPATLTVNGLATSLDTNNNFNVSILLPNGTNNVPVVAQDSSGNTRTNKYQVVVAPGSTTSLTYDADGNELTNGLGQTYTWDALNELVTIAYASGAHTVFTYDALGHRIGIVEWPGAIGSGSHSTKQLVWNGDQIAEERNASNTVTKRFYAQGEQFSGTSSYYYTFDHLGSVREMTNSSGTIYTRYDYDPYGRVTPTYTSANTSTPPLDSDFQYAGYYEHATSGLSLTKYRAYDSNTGKWLSRDPLGENAGVNIYAYVLNDPVSFTDPLGLCPIPPRLGPLPTIRPYPAHPPLPFPPAPYVPPVPPGKNGPDIPPATKPPPYPNAPPASPDPEGPAVPPDPNNPTPPPNNSQTSGVTPPPDIIKIYF